MSKLAMIENYSTAHRSGFVATAKISGDECDSQEQALKSLAEQLEKRARAIRLSLVGLPTDDSK